MNPTVRPSFIAQIDWCRQLGSPLYAEILSIALDDLDRGGSVARVVENFTADAIPEAMPLRFMGGLHRLVLAGRAPQLARHYPSAGGTPNPDSLTQDVISTVGEHIDLLRASLDIPPQTNEIGRSVALFAGLMSVLAEDRLPVNLLEIGSSAGLNLLLDTFSYETGAWQWSGVPDAPVLTPEWSGGHPRVPASIRIDSRRGCDTNPIDVTDGVQRERLVSFVWADQLDRFERLNRAIDLVGPGTFQLDREDARNWLEQRLAEPTTPGTITVVQHSVMWQYLSDETASAIDAMFDEVGSRATDERPLARVAFEWSRDGDRTGHTLTVQRWPGDGPKVLGHGHPHGSWFTWE